MTGIKHPPWTPGEVTEANWILPCYIFKSHKKQPRIKNEVFLKCWLDLFCGERSGKQRQLKSLCLSIELQHEEVMISYLKLRFNFQHQVPYVKAPEVGISPKRLLISGLSYWTQTTVKGVWKELKVISCYPVKADLQSLHQHFVQAPFNAQSLCTVHQNLKKECGRFTPVFQILHQLRLHLKKQKCLPKCNLFFTSTSMEILFCILYEHFKFTRPFLITQCLVFCHFRFSAIVHLRLALYSQAFLCF